MRKIVMAGNWKMNKTVAEAKNFAEEFIPLVKGKTGEVDVVINAPYTDLPLLTELFKDTEVKVGAQNMHFAENGTYTGEISAKMLAELGVTHVILGHSERRAQFSESNEFVNQKLKAALEAGLTPFLCVGDTLEERQSGKFEKVVETQLRGSLEGVSSDDMLKIIVAYEPIWAISKGVVLEGGASLVATPEVADESCGFVRSVLANMYGEDVAEKITVQYGGSMASGNSTELLAQENIDGGLIGGASLKPEEFANTILNVVK